jgi:hypothetical protein
LINFWFGLLWRRFSVETDMASETRSNESWNADDVKYGRPVLAHSRRT